ncbi:MAG: glutaredoxin [Gammaproteobacteria bacterium]|nr:glutaredoxin [Gammaproteobacteria bacterium]
MSAITIYTTVVCPKCDQAKALLKSRNIDYEERIIEGNRQYMKEMLRRTKMKTVPQIFAGEHWIGNHEALAEKLRSGELERLLTDQ